MEFQLALSAAPGSHQFFIVIEPEAMEYEFPKESKVVLAFRGPDAMLAELAHYPDAVVIWRPADTQVWATTADGRCEQIAGFEDNPAPGLDTGGKPLDRPLRQLLESTFYNQT
ncbi:hypothetical protein SAMN04244553_4799 [Nocardia amikacinitolerans]|uniref:Uncharacterized protein n=1 Tax=Nocardia amikacinitolerans TaxID=756689 RepID=A0A285LSE1_9NOCA|nr:hypothetical protein [Nocardia amikacinitolerans]MCP2280013.1 hypothetical protein [Nocardia amikacinitolerans]MCP2295717.1 hypothetical protein [Nocardia amikacinitolerans]SNY87840.1 hypothetical protein SAMN04244553_4799 [Nocardia amikacinitolerans]